MKYKIISVLFFLSLILIWQILAMLQIWPKYVMPGPIDVAKYLYKSLLDGSLLEASWITLKRLSLGYLAGIILGIPIGLALARSEFLKSTLGLLALGLQTLPSVCWAPIAILWFGQTEIAMFFIVIMGCIWSVILLTAQGVEHVPPIFVKAALTLGSKGSHLWTHVIVPASFPFILSGMKQGWAFAWRSLMAAEIYITILTGFGLGHLLHYGRELHNMEAVIGIMLIIIVIGLFVDKLVFSPLEKNVHKKYGTSKSPLTR